MEYLSEVAVKNLLFLSDKDAFLANQYKLNNKEFVTSEDDTYDTIYSFSELEYPIYFTFHQLMNHIHSSYDSTIHGYTRQELLSYMNQAITTLVDYYENVEGVDESFEVLLDDLEEKIYLIEGYYKYGWFLWIPTKMKEYMNYACLKVLRMSRDITEEYIQYLQDPCGYDQDNHDGIDGDSECEGSDADDGSDDGSNDADSDADSDAADLDGKKED